jgi:hypothetical protein
MSYEQIQALINLDIYTLQAFSQNDIIQRIPPQILAEIKQKDEHPFFQLYSVCHEGTSTPKIEGKGYKPITWFREAIQSIKNVIKKGIKFFDGHNETNDKQNKQILGEVIHAFEEEIDNKLHYCTIGYFPPETKNIAKNMDICSQEAEWNLIETAGRLIAESCLAVTGIALANSKDSQPAFKDAKRLAYLQAFENISEGNSRTGEVQMDYNDILKTSNKDVVKRLIEDLQLHPNQLFDLKGIQEDREFSKIFEGIKSKDTDIQAKNMELEKIKQENTKLNRSIQLQNAKGKLSDLYKQNNLTENIKKFIDDIYEENKEKIEDLSENGLKSFVESQTRIFQKANANEKIDNKIIPSGDNIDTSTEKNPFLKEDYNPEDYI